MINVASGKAVNLLQLLARLRPLTGAPHVKEKFAPARPGDMRVGRASIAKARKLLGYSPRISLDDGLGEVVDYLRKGLA